MSNYNTKELKWPSMTLSSKNYTIYYNDSDVLMQITRTSKNGVWVMRQYPKYENNQFVPGFNSILRNDITGAVYVRVDGKVRAYASEIAYRKCLLYKIRN